jgi:hypothetical protein
MNWENYEDVVREVYEKLGQAQGVRIVCHGRDCKVTGKSGVEHQVDVLTEHSDGLHNYRTAIECKYWNRRRPKDDVMKLAEILEDTHINKGVIVSQYGFTEDAVAFARYKNVALVELRKPTEKDWEGRVRDIHVRLVARIPITTDFRIDVAQSPTVTTALSGGAVDPTLVTIREPNNGPVTLCALMNQLIAAADKEHDDTSLVRREFAPGTTIESAKDKVPVCVAAVQFMLRFEREERLMIIKGEDHVSMILKSVFENRRFVISPEGRICESEG